jgi:hypothetical protein
MFSIRKLLGNEDKFYDLLEASAQQADTSVHHLSTCSQSWSIKTRRKALRSSSIAGGRTNRSPRS